MRPTFAVGCLLALLCGCGDDDDASSPQPSGENTDSAGDSGADSAAIDADVAWADGQNADTGPARKDFAWDPAKPGPYRVGYHTFELTYDAQKGGVPPRTLTVHTWYPTNTTDGPMPTYFNTWPADFYYSWDGEKVIADAAPAAPVHAKYPTLVVSHGHLGFGPSTAGLHHWFASHGWYVAAPDHVTDTISDVGNAQPAWMRTARGYDISATLDALGADPKAGTAAKNAALDKVVLAGHSRGGATTWAMCGAAYSAESVSAMCKSGALKGCDDAIIAGYAAGIRDPRIIAGIPMAGAGGEDWFGKDGHSKTAVPQLAMTGGADGNQPKELERIWTAAPDVALTWVHVDGACHQAFAMGTCKKTEIGKVEAFAINGAYGLAFARWQLLGDRSAKTAGILHGSVVVSPRVTLKKR